MAHINLLPWRETQRARQRQQYLSILGAVAIGAVGVVMATQFWLGQMQQQQQVRNQYLQGEIQKLDSQIRQINKIKQQRETLLTRIDVIKALQQQRHVPVQVLNELARVMVPGVYLTHIEVQGDAVVLEGYCESNNHLANMMRQVKAARWLAEPRVQQIVAGDEERAREHHFRLDVIVLPLGDGPKVQEERLALNEGERDES
ncbi:PilN domain-containing protein [Ferrimonas marina]|uniref:Type IV pilus assembly protein PilN n=1 Tax=Ferrimonas marina TaxID=299255 RepID=A0A1M5XHN4_9GAMM|nr:PilN domain-containing protein [Ferrimonas marina]SHH99024.1 type IV pilus assembly protein PilN [Ferrimonas marina]